MKWFLIIAVFNKELGTGQIQVHPSWYATEELCLVTLDFKAASIYKTIKRDSEYILSCRGIQPHEK